MWKIFNVSKSKITYITGRAVTIFYNEWNLEIVNESDGQKLTLKRVKIHF